MQILIDNHSGAPIYDQIFSQIKAQIISGALAPDELLPSIRALARDLRVISSALKMVAASRLRRVQILVDKNLGYSENLRRSALRVLTEIQNEEKKDIYKC